MAEHPKMPLWTDAYLGDTTHLTTIEHGAYLLLLIAAWRSRDNSLPDDDKLLARYAKLTPGQWKRISTVVRPFFKVENGRLFQSRLTREAEAVRQYSKSQKDKADGRWLKYNDTGDADASVRHIPENASQSQSQSHKKEEEKTKAKKKACGGTLDLPIDQPQNGEVSEPGKPPEPDYDAEFEDWWSRYPAKVAKKAAKDAFVKARKIASKEELDSGLSKYIAGKPADRQWAHAATWLNQERWTDEFPAQPVAGGGGHRGEPDEFLEAAQRVIDRIDGAVH